MKSKNCSEMFYRCVSARGGGTLRGNDSAVADADTGRGDVLKLVMRC